MGSDNAILVSLFSFFCAPNLAQKRNIEPRLQPGEEKLRPVTLRLTKLLAQVRAQQQRLVTAALERKLAADATLDHVGVTVSGRTKETYSLWRKLESDRAARGRSLFKNKVKRRR